MQHDDDRADNNYLYKGKATHRSWPQLPEEIVRLITTHYLWDIAGSSYCPQSLDTRKSWYSRLVYTCIRDTQDLEKNLMPICPEWRRAIEKHAFWNQAIHVLDPNDYLIFHMTIHPKPQLNGSSNANSGPIHLTPYQHLRNILNASCLVCRLNNPLSNIGLAAAKKYATTAALGLITVCREHNHRRGIFCGSCLRDEPVTHHPDRLTREQELAYSPGVLENEDDDTWPHIDATCRRCRSEWLWRKACASGFPNDREAIGGPTFQCGDWETRQNVEGFIEMAEGNIADVLTLAREKSWLRMNTKYDSLGQHLLAAQRTQQRHHHHHHELSQHEEEEEDEEDEEEDRELMLMRGAGQVRDLALQDWARHRILDGHWFSPADLWYNIVVPGQPLVVPTVHPCPWSRDVDSSSMDTSGSGSGAGSGTGEEEAHPLRATVAGEVPPSFALCEQAYVAHMKQFREILGPALRNVVRKIVMESSVRTTESGSGSGGYGDPAHIARKMSLEEVVRILREEEGVWFDGVDWVEKKRNEEEAKRRRRMEELKSQSVDVGQTTQAKEEDSDSMSSTGSNVSSGKASSTQGSSSSNATSPVLSTSTVQTTPSPCPLSGDDHPGPSTTSTSTATTRLKADTDTDENDHRHRHNGNGGAPKSIVVDPIRSTPRLLSKVPYVPMTVSHLPQYSLEAIRVPWREATAPLYQCACRICERARFAEINARAAYAGVGAGGFVVPPVVPQQQQQQQAPPTAQTRVGGGKLETPAVAVGDIELKEIVDVINHNHNHNLDAEGDEEVDYDPSDYDDDDDDDDDEDEEDEVDEVELEGEADGFGFDEDGNGNVLYPVTSTNSNSNSETRTYRYHNVSPETERKRDPGPEPHHRDPLTHHGQAQAQAARSLKRSSDELEDTSGDVPLPLPLPHGAAGGGLGGGRYYNDHHDKAKSRSNSASISPTTSVSRSPTTGSRQYPDRRELEGIPAKRARLGDADTDAAGVNNTGAGTVAGVVALSPSPPAGAVALTLPPAVPAAATPTPNTGTVRQRKRSNEELNGDVVDERTGPYKRARMDRAPSPSSPSPFSSSHSQSTLSSSSSSPVSAPIPVPVSAPVSVSVPALNEEEEEEEDVYLPVCYDEDKPYVPPGNGIKRARVRGIRQSDMDKLIPMDDMDE